jgi:hypothetical protein
VSLPAADDLFRPTAKPDDAKPDDAAPAREPEGTRGAGSRSKAKRNPSGRVRHDEKMTVYVTAEELLDLEHARLSLRRTHGLAVDRGRLVREAVAIALADLDANGDESVLVQRLMQA